LPVAQSVSTVHVVLQVLLVVQAKLPAQGAAVGVAQDPAPVQVGAGV
jgi:hypothetical protein